MTTLTDFASERKPKKRCFTCNLPEDLLSQVETARLQDKPLPLLVISRWLTAEGHPIEAVTLNNHFRFGHHLRRGTSA